VIANQLKRQKVELVKLKETLEAKNVSELKFQVRQVLRKSVKPFYFYLKEKATSSYILQLRDSRFFFII
jgi:hypothetical protein